MTENSKTSDYILERDNPCRGYEIYRRDKQPVAYNEDSSHYGTSIKRVFIPDKLMDFLLRVK